MDFGCHLPHFGSDVSAEGVKRFALRAEALGMHSVWVSDHITWPERIESPYPYTEDGVWPSRDPHTPRLDAIGTLLFVAGFTQRVQLGSTVLILGYRPPVQTAKLWATLDAVSGGRAILGVGVGWMREEFETLGMPFDHRGARADEQLEVFEALFTQESPSYEGRFYRFPPVGFEPKPLGGRIPIWVGGDSQAALRRAARYGDALHAAHRSVQEVAQQWTDVRRYCEELGRDPADLQLSVRLRLDFDGVSDRPNAIRGSIDEMVQRIGEYAAVSTSHILLDVMADGVDAQLDALERFTETVQPQIA